MIKIFHHLTLYKWLKIYGNNLITLLNISIFVYVKFYNYKFIHIGYQNFMKKLIY